MFLLHGATSVNDLLPVPWPQLRIVPDESLRVPPLQFASDATSLVQGDFDGARMKTMICRGSC
jgi:hypothetical protein